MGNQRHYGLGYGFEVPEKGIRDSYGMDIDVWDLVEDEYPELDYHLSGYYWNPESVYPSLITIKAVTLERNDFKTGQVGSIIRSEIPEAGLKQLLELKTRLGVKDDPDWLIWNYEG